MLKNLKNYIIIILGVVGMLLGKPAYIQAQEADDFVLIESIVTHEIEDVKICVSGFLPENVELKVVEIKDVNSSKAQIEDTLSFFEKYEIQKEYDISLWVGDREYQPEEYNQTVKITIENLNIDGNSDIVIYHLTDKIEDIYKVKRSAEKKIEIETTHFSSFVIGSTTYDTNSMTYVTGGTINNTTATWEIYKSGTEYILYVTGDYTKNTSFVSYTDCPWNDYKSTITKVYFDMKLTVRGTPLTYLFMNLKNATEIVFGENFKSSSSKASGSLFGMFVGCEKLKTLNLVGFTPSGVTSFEFFLSSCKSLEQVTFDHTLNTSSVSNAQLMFQSCDALTKIDMSLMDFSAVSSAFGVVSNCFNLTEIRTPKNFKAKSYLPYEKGTIWYDITEPSKLYITFPQNEPYSRTLRAATGYAVFFYDHEGDVILGETPVLPGGTAVYNGTTPTRESTDNVKYTFDKWVTTVGGTEEATLSNITKTQNVYASYKETSAVKISFNSNGGSEVATTLNVFVGETIGTLPTPTREGYAFKGWTTSTGTVITAATISTFTTDTVLYATWSLKDAFSIEIPDEMVLVYDESLKQFVGRATIKASYRIQASKVLKIDVSVTSADSKIMDTEQGLGYVITAAYEDGTRSCSLSQTDEAWHEKTLVVVVTSTSLLEPPPAGEYMGKLGVNVEFD